MKQIMFFLMCAGILILPGYTQAGLVVIANNSVADSTVSKQDVKMIFLGKKKSWEDGKKIKPATLKAGDSHESFVTTYVEKTAASFSSFWKHAILSGTGIPPKSFSSEGELLKYVAGKEGAVGYISSDTPYSESGVKVLSIK